MSLYQTSAYCLLVGVTLVAFPSIAYIMLNSYVAPIYKAITTTLERIYKLFNHSIKWAFEIQNKDRNDSRSHQLFSDIVVDCKEAL